MTLQTTTISFFRFEGAKAQFWAFGQMPLARGPLNRTPGISFCKLMGSGSGESFDPKPNFGVYTVLLVWPSEQSARRGVAASRTLAKYREVACEHSTVFLQALHARGKWDGVEPFEASPTASGMLPSPLGIITRATLKRSKLLTFWKSVPAISKALAVDDSVLFKLGMGEVPWVQQVTFSAWRDLEHMQQFAYRNGPHREAVNRVREGDWFREDLFARFRIIDWNGTWGGKSPLAEFLKSGPGDASGQAPKLQPVAAA